MNTLKSIGFLILEILLYVFLTIVIAGAFTLLITVVTPAIFDTYEAGTLENPWLELYIGYVPIIIGSLLALWICHRLIFKRVWSVTGLIMSHWLRDFWIGVGIGCLLITVGFCMLWLGQGVEIEKIEFIPNLFFGFLSLFLVQSAFEEIATRSFLIPTIERRFGVLLSVLVSSILFAMLHGSNPNISIIALANIFAAGVLLGMLFVRYRSVWPAIGLHVAWNFLQGSFYGFEVSGYDVYSVIDSKETGADWITGGEFGYEGSVLALVSLIVTCYLVWRGKPSTFSTLPIYKTEEDIPSYTSLIDEGN